MAFNVVIHAPDPEVGFDLEARRTSLLNARERFRGSLLTVTDSHYGTLFATSMTFALIKLNNSPLEEVAAAVEANRDRCEMIVDGPIIRASPVIQSPLTPEEIEDREKEADDIGPLQI